MRICAFLFAAALALTANAWWSNDGEQPYGKISDEFVSPHFEICPDPPKKLKVFVTAWGVGQREVVELKERFAYEPVLFPQLSIGKFYPFSGKGGAGYCASLDADGYREVCAEKLTQKFVRPDGMTQWDWAKNGPNHWGDVLSGCFVVASSIGLYDSTEAAVSNAVTREDPTIAVPVVRKARRKFVLRKRR